MSTADDALQWAQNLQVPAECQYIYFRYRLPPYDAYLDIESRADGSYMTTYWPRDKRYTCTGTHEECKQWLIAMIAANI
jgi:hypothetical protein